MIDVRSQADALEEASIHVGGEVDLNTSPKLREALKSAAAQKMKTVTVHLREVTYMDSSGIATLVEMLQAMLAYQGRLVLKGMRPQVRAVFEIAHLTEVFDIVE